MRRKKTKELEPFIASDTNGNLFEIRVFQEIQSEFNWVPSIKWLETCQGIKVNCLAQGKYVFLDHISLEGVELSSDDPNAP